MVVLGTSALIAGSSLSVAEAAPSSPAGPWPNSSLICGGGLLRMSRSISGAINCGGQINQFGICYTVGLTDPGYRDVTNQYGATVWLFKGRGCTDDFWVADPGHRLVAPSGDPSFGWHSFVAP
jgi:hypothetical protein